MRKIMKPGKGECLGIWGRAEQVSSQEEERHAITLAPAA